MSQMILVCGMSGSGKTTFSKRYAEENNLVYISVDDYYKKINGDECIHENLFEVWSTMWNDIHNYEINNIDILVDTNALTVGQREQFLNWFPTFEHHLIWNEAKLSTCLRNNRNRRRQIPEERMKEMFSEIEYPYNKDYNNPNWKSIIIRVNQDNNFQTFVWKGEK